jgi:dTDP-4-dehydrorhamnose 3,5-epimerase
VWDVAVDIRIGSPTFLRWHAIHLSEENERALLIPEGFAHGFQALTNDAELIYCHSAPYSSSDEGGLSVLDTSLDIRWPLPVVELSSRDAGYPSVISVFEGASL